MNQSRKKSGLGFTLGELPAVIAILAALCAILFPILAQQRERSEQTVCLSNMKQLALGIDQYAQDYDERFPNGINPSGTGSGWAGQMYPYVKSTSVFLCPSDTTPRAKSVSYSSYGYNSQNVVPASKPGGHQCGQRLSQYNSPSKTVLLFEVTGSSGYTISPFVGDTITSPPDFAPTKATSFVAGDDYSPKGGGSAAGYGVGGPFDPSGFNSNAGISGGSPSTLKYATGYLLNMRQGSAKNDFAGPAGRHRGGANYAFVDGHVRFLRPSAVSGGYPNTASGNTSCGGKNPRRPTAAQTLCPDIKITATFNVQ